MIVTLFRSRLRPEAVDEYTMWAKEISDLAKRQPGYVSEKTFTASDGERVTIAVFENEEATLAWRNQLRHTEAQLAGRERFYSEYHVQVCSVLRSYDFSREDRSSG